jgi:hypothetical protein
LLKSIAAHIRLLKASELAEEMNRRGRLGQPFFFIWDYAATEGYVFTPQEAAARYLL